MRTCDAHRIKGWFFLPESPDTRLPGILTWSQDRGAGLELIGGFSPEPEYDRIDGPIHTTSQIVGETFPSTIYGESDSGKKISLWNAERGNYKAGAIGRVQEEFWHTSWVCIGAHVPSANAAVLRGFKVALDDLYYLTGDGRFCAPQWASIEGVDNPGEKQDDGTYLLPYILPVVGGHRASYASGSTADMTYSIDTHATSPWVSPATEANPALKLDFMTNRLRRGPSIELSVGAYARAEPIDDSANSAEEFLHGTKPLLDLVSLATFDSSGVEWMRAQTVDGDEVSLLCHTGNSSKPDQRTEAGGVVFTLDDVPLDSFLETWRRLTSGDQAQYAWSMVVGLIGHAPLLVEEHVSQVLAAAEGFHTWCLSGGKNADLKTRLMELHDGLPEELKIRLQLNVDHWVDWSVWARNHVAHGGTKKHRKISDFYQLKTIADSVRLVLYLAALKEFRVPDGRLTTALSTHRRLVLLAERCTEIAALPAVEV
jgi:hypothetical protein